MNKYVKWITNIIVTLFLVFVALLLTILIVYIVNDSFKGQDTILAGCIGFIGAIIGGAITYVGVNKTLEEQRKKEEVKALERKYFAIQEFILELDDVRTALGSLKFRIEDLHKSVDIRGYDTINKLLIIDVNETSNTIQELRKNKEFIRKMEGLGYELYSSELSFLKDLNTSVLSLKAVKDDSLASSVYLIAYENIGSVIEKANKKYIELIKQKQKVRKEIRNF
ncbi:hypothetical protein [Lysinibacillus fusiformis]|uniref:hypothetical protein n=1 Tax=Lysinibacillus fusiformis TaxID=28031 RepID=UPI003D02F4AF